MFAIWYVSIYIYICTIALDTVSDKKNSEYMSTLGEIYLYAEIYLDGEIYLYGEIYLLVHSLDL